MNSFEIRSEVKNGILTRNRNLIIDAINHFEGKQVIINIEKVKNKRSNQLNRYYWGCIIPIMQNALKETGNLMTNENVHDLLKLRFLKVTINVNEETGELIERIKSTTELSNTEFCEFIALIQQFASEYFNTIIPDPNSETTLNFN